MRHEPICVVTDQDPAVKIAVACVFGTSKHRFCMWHIMCKVGEKVGPVLAKDEVFRRKLNDIVWNKSIDSKTPLALEKHAMDVYTISVFYDVQVEICEGCFSCQVVSLCECDVKVCYGIKDGDKKAWCVEFLLADSTATCSCKMFERMGVLTNLMWSEIYACVGLADGNVERLEQLRRVICEQREFFLKDGCEDDNGVAGSSKESVIKSFCGDVSQGSTVEVRDPIKAKNKGSGKQMKSAREKAANKCVKQSRKCHTCDEYGHNSRTCPLNG
ncbi:PREDICTED: uncharacterized protein LOC109155285 [Ipomoea nil]|uniref:uncharacterized protein LOC109155285 n=1 Tax=Ipomoea nil TaxID=35883 RepID=UPI000900A358|nr:PREDICTED: uncharacterized protein LOC109155285 [Ipomoea nil]